MQHGVAHVFLSPRSLDCLQSNTEGYCLDATELQDIDSGEDTDSFQRVVTKQAVRKGATVASSPLMQILNQMELEMVGPSARNDDEERDDDASPCTKQLLLNYCFGHGSAQPLLCPTLNIGLLKHDKKPNVALRWSKSVVSDIVAGDREAVLRVDDQKWESYQTRSGFDFVALRNINEGEELTLHYGLAWQEAKEQGEIKRKDFRLPLSVPNSVFPLRWRSDYRDAASLNLGKSETQMPEPETVRA